MMDVKPLTVEAFAKKVETKSPLFLVDVRDEEKYLSGSLQIEGIPLINLPYVTMQSSDSQLSDIVAHLPKDAQIVTVCTSGNKAEKAAALLREQGLTVQSLHGGLTEWKAQTHNTKKHD